MKKTSTPFAVQGTTCESRRNLSPRKSTIAFLRQFARVYCPAPSPALPGIILN
ncbi:MAG: hypothetical protein K2M19_02240 [Muribaculaceae bacterium]|nr:hypothetical protein [Muribaculaceae bacterium]